MSVQAAPPDYELTEEDGIWVATHVESGVTSQGSTSTEAVEMAREAVTLASQEYDVGDEVFQRRMLEECGINPDEVDEEIETSSGMP